MKKIIVSSFVICMLLILSASFSLAAPKTTVCRGIIKTIDYELERNRMKVVISKELGDDIQGTAYLSFNNEASKKLAELIHLAFVHKIRVKIWVPFRAFPTILKINFSKSPLRIMQKKYSPKR